MLKWDFNKVALQICWNRTLTWVFPANFLHIIRIPFLKNPSGGPLLNLRWIRNKHMLNSKDYARGVRILYGHSLIKCKPGLDSRLQWIDICAWKSCTKVLQTGFIYLALKLIPLGLLRIQKFQGAGDYFQNCALNFLKYFPAEIIPTQIQVIY